jgi:hypothetical protein
MPSFVKSFFLMLKRLAKNENSNVGLVIKRAWHGFLI